MTRRLDGTSGYTANFHMMSARAEMPARPASEGGGPN
jgi:hypothetical protein